MKVLKSNLEILDFCSHSKKRRIFLDRQTDRQTHKHTHTHTERERERERERGRERERVPAFGKEHLTDTE